MPNTTELMPQSLTSSKESDDEIKAIRTEADYLHASLPEVSALISFNPAADSAEGERLPMLGTLVQAYEAKHSLDPPGAD